MAKKKTKKSEKKQRKRNERTIKNNPTPSKTSAVAVIEYAPHGSVDVKPAASVSTSIIVAGSANRFLVRQSPHKNSDGPMMELIDKASKKLLVRYFLHPRLDPIMNIYEARLHEVCGNTPIELLSGPQQQQLANILRAIEYAAIAMF
jgi:hypothetical protein